nr:hypothetical protein [Parabacteroides goldsteinii]
MKVYGTEGEIIYNDQVVPREPSVPPITILNKSGQKLLEVQVDDDSYRYRSLSGSNLLKLMYSLPVHVDLPIGSYVDYQGERYTLWLPENFKKEGNRIFEYTVEFGGIQEMLKKFKFKLLSSKPYDLKFTFAAKPRDFLQMLVDNLNLFDSGWTVGKCIDAPEKTLSFNHENCYTVANRYAQEFDTEIEFVGKTINFCKTEYFKDAPLALSFGKGNGFKSGIGRQNDGDKRPITRLYVVGGEKNIDFSTYNSKSLLLPKSQELEFEGKKYKTDEDGTFIVRADKELIDIEEDSLDATDIYPKRVGTVSKVEVTKDGFYDVFDASIPAELDFSQMRLKGEKATIIFQSGNLASREFDIVQTDEALTGYIHSERRFKLVSSEEGGIAYPNEILCPNIGDTYAVFHIKLPGAYICNNSDQSGASWDMFREGVRYFSKRDSFQFSFKGELNEIWAKQNWIELGGKIKPGSYVEFSDTHFQPDGILIRMTGVKDYVNNPESPTIELSNAPSPGSLSDELGKIDSNEVVNEDRYKSALSFTMRRYQDMIETGKMLEKAIEGFSASINPITISTMQVRLGAEQLQFRFVTSKTNPSEIIPNFVMNNTTRVFSAPSCILQHMSLGITKVSPKHTPDEYKFWDMQAYISPYLGNDKSPYYLYAKCSKSGTTGTFLLSKDPHKMEEGNYYFFLVGTLGTEWEDIRSFTTCYGFTEILPGRMIINLITSTDGKTYFNLAEGEIGGKLKFASGTTGYENIKDKPDLSIYGTTAMLNAVKGDLQNQIDGKIETYYQTSNPWNSWASGTEPAHVGDLWFNTSTGVLQCYVGPSSNTWREIVDKSAIEAAQAAAKAADIKADGKRRVFIRTPYPPYDAGDQWIEYGGSGSMRICVQGRQSGSYYSSDWQISSADGNTQASIDRGVISAAGFLTFGGSAGMVGPGTIRIWSGGTNANNATFKVYSNGNVISDGTITANNSIILRDQSAGISGYGTANSSIRFWAGNEDGNVENSRFTVNKRGDVYAYSIDGQNITARSGLYAKHVELIDGDVNKDCVELFAAKQSAGIEIRRSTGAVFNRIANFSTFEFERGSGSYVRIGMNARNFTNDASWLYRTCIEATKMPTEAQINTLGSTGNRYNVGWDEKSGLFYIH